jgi:hypothetical protein
MDSRAKCCGDCNYCCVSSCCGGDGNYCCVSCCCGGKAETGEKGTPFGVDWSNEDGVRREEEVLAKGEVVVLQLL